jgi:outer membrane murein-binding lipoprotein Lpp
MASLAVLAAVVGWTVGCKSSGYQQGDKTAANIRKAADRIEALPAQIEKTLARLSDLVNNPQADLRPQFKRYSSDLEKLESSVEHVQGARRAMAEQGKAFFDEWDQQLARINNEDIKARSQSRKDDVAARFVAIKTSYEETEKNFVPLVRDLRDVHRFLKVDLTTAGVAAVRGTVAKAMQDSAPLNESITRLAQDFEALGVAMSSVVPRSKE